MEDNKRIANEELKNVFESDVFANLFIQNSSESLSGYKEIPSISNSDEGNETTIVNNNVSLSLQSNGSPNTIEREIRNFLKTESITDPLELKKNYTISLNQNIVDFAKEQFKGSQLLIDENSNFTEAIQQKISPSVDLQEIENIVNETRNNFYSTSNLNIFNEQSYRDLTRVQFPSMFKNSSFDSINEIEHKLQRLENFQQNFENNLTNTMGSFDPTRSMKNDPMETAQELMSEMTESLEENQDLTTSQISERMSSTPSQRTNINKSSIQNSSINYLIDKMNSPPIWRTVLG